jgi:two-component system LytT family sensor kinase
MTYDYSPFIWMSFFCIVFSTVLLLRLKSSLGEKREIHTLRLMFICYIVLTAADIFWAMTEANLLEPPKLLNAAVNAAADMAVSWGCYYWYRFVAERAGLFQRMGKTLKTVLVLPTVIVSILLLLTIFTKWLFYIDSTGHYRNTSLVYLRVFINFFYLLLSAVYSAYRVFRVKSRQERMEYAGYALYILLSVGIYYLEDLFPQCPMAELVIFLALLILYLTTYVDMEKDLLQQQEELTQSRLAIMRSQIQPHFLYNALSTIQNLCHSGAPEAEEALISFSKFLRGNLDSLSQSEPIPFERELSHTQQFLLLEEKRFGQRMRVEYDIRAREFMIPALTLQPIVENAVQHGIVERMEGGTVRISTEETENAWVIRVTDDGVGFDVNEVREDGRSHVGISNVRDRLSQMCGGSLTIQSVPGKGTEAVIQLPKERGEKDERTDH